MKRALLFSMEFLPLLAFAQGWQDIPPLLPPQGEMQPTYLEQHHLQIIIGAVAIIIFLTLTILWLARPKLTIIEAPIIEARRALAALRGRKEDGELIAEVSRILRRYIWAVLHFPPGELTTIELRQTLQNHSQISAELSEAVNEFFRQCDEWKFAPTPPTPQTSVVVRALELVEKLEAEQHTVAEVAQ